MEQPVFIKLTGENGEELYIKHDALAFIEFKPSHHTYVGFSRTGQFVKETPEKILELVGKAYHGG